MKNVLLSGVVFGATMLFITAASAVTLKSPGDVCESVSSQTISRLEKGGFVTNNSVSYFTSVVCPVSHTMSATGNMAISISVDDNNPTGDISCFTYINNGTTMIKGGTVNSSGTGSRKTITLPTLVAIAPTTQVTFYCSLPPVSGGLMSLIRGFTATY